MAAGLLSVDMVFGVLQWNGVINAISKRGITVSNQIRLHEAVIAVRRRCFMGTNRDIITPGVGVIYLSAYFEGQCNAEDGPLTHEMTLQQTIMGIPYFVVYDDKHPDFLIFNKEIGQACQNENVITRSNG